MSTTIRPELSKKNKYYIDKHRYYELKHFCLQYPSWKQKYRQLSRPDYPVSMIREVKADICKADPTGDRAILKERYSKRINLVEKVSTDADAFLSPYILKAVTKGVSFKQLQTMWGIPCGKDMYYDRYRKFFWLLSQRLDDIY